MSSESNVQVAQRLQPRFPYLNPETLFEIVNQGFYAGKEWERKSADPTKQGVIVVLRQLRYSVDSAISVLDAGWVFKDDPRFAPLPKNVFQLGGFEVKITDPALQKYLKQYLNQ